MCQINEFAELRRTQKLKIIVSQHFYTMNAVIHVPELNKIYSKFK